MRLLAAWELPSRLRQLRELTRQAEEAPLKATVGEEAQVGLELSRLYGDPQPDAEERRKVAALDALYGGGVARRTWGASTSTSQEQPMADERIAYWLKQLTAVAPKERLLGLRRCAKRARLRNNSWEALYELLVLLATRSGGLPSSQPRAAGI
jgi:hypothetical protein